MSNKVEETSAHYFVKDGAAVGGVVNKELRKVPRGYRQTEVGIIPFDWALKTLREIASTISVGLVINPSSYFDERGTVPMLVGSTVSENKIDSDKANLITEASNRKIPASRLSAGDLVTVRVGEPGITAVVPPELDGCNCASMMIVRKKNSFNSNWLCFLMNSDLGLSQIRNVQYGTAQKQFNISDAVGFLYPYPELVEQTAIANALSDVDALITSLEKLITKKRAIKTAAMQQLLTGKKRLPPFDTLNNKNGTPRYKKTELGEIPVDWEVCNLPQYVWYQEGPGLRNWQFTTKGMKVINVTNLQYSGFLDLDKTDRHISIELYEKMYRHFECDAGDFVMASSGNSYSKSSVVRECDLPLLMNTSVIRFKARENIESSYMKSYLKSTFFKDQIDLMITGGAQPNFGPYHLNRIFLPIPSSLEEQTAIATVLSDMENDLEALRQRLNKTQQIKQGMMQELLTGKTRLVECTA